MGFEGKDGLRRSQGEPEKNGTVNLIGNADPTRADMGFGLRLAVQTTPGIVRTAGSVGSFSWPGAYGTNWWADPKEQLVVVFMAQTPGPIRWHYRYVVNAIVNQAIVDLVVGPPLKPAPTNGFRTVCHVSPLPPTVSGWSHVVNGARR